MARKIFPAFCLIVVCLILGIEATTKYDRTKNRANNMDLSSLGREFKSRQVIQVWQKAHRMELSKEKLKELHRDLVRLDSMYYKAKKEGATEESENQIRKTGNAEMAVERQMRETLKKYGMDGGFPKDARDMKFPASDDMPFADRKIAQLWIKAQKSKMFSDAELAELKDELSNHQEKTDQFNNLMEEVHGPDGSKSNSVKRFDNKSPEEVQKIRSRDMELKLRHRELSREFEKLAARTIPEEERGPFVDNRVITLWKEARGQNFSQEDLRLIMEELKDFEDRILAHDDAHREALESDMKQRARGDRAPDKNRANKDRSLFERAKEMGRSVNEKMRQLRHKISQGGSWLDEL